MLHICNIYDFDIINLILENTNYIDNNNNIKSKLINLLVFFVNNFVKIEKDDIIFIPKDHTSFTYLDILYEN